MKNLILDVNERWSSDKIDDLFKSPDIYYNRLIKDNFDFEVFIKSKKEKYKDAN